MSARLLTGQSSVPASRTRPEAPFGARGRPPKLIACAMACRRTATNERFPPGRMGTGEHTSFSSILAFPRNADKVSSPWLPYPSFRKRSVPHKLLLLCRREKRLHSEHFHLTWSYTPLPLYQGSAGLPLKKSWYLPEAPP